MGKVAMFAYSRIGEGMEFLEMIVSPRYCVGLTGDKSPILLR